MLASQVLRAGSKQRYGSVSLVAPRYYCGYYLGYLQLLLLVAIAAEDRRAVFKRDRADVTCPGIVVRGICARRLDHRAYRQVGLLPARANQAIRIDAGRALPLFDFAF